MKRLSKYSTKPGTSSNQLTKNEVVNFMNGVSYKVSPISELKIVAASSIFGEPQYYRSSGISTPETSDTAAAVFTKAIDKALDYNFKETLLLALELRTVYHMRLNPAVIFVRANQHKNRESFNKENPGFMKQIGKSIVFRPDDITNQLEYYMYLNGSKRGLSSFMKRTWASRLEEFSRYQLNKYKGKKLIDLVRISHANSADINELMQSGTIKVTETEKTWEILRSEKKSWREILETIDMPHMALLRNLRGIFTEIEDVSSANQILDALKNGVSTGKQFPFRYFSAYKAVKSSDNLYHRDIILRALEDCIDISVENMPRLEGRTMCLSDNSGSAWGAINSEYGTVTVAEIANLSSLITAMQSDEGEVGVFGDNLIIEKVSSKIGLLHQHESLNKIEKQDRRVGGSTENGIWIFWRDAIEKKEHYDNVFIYSDMQAGTGELFGINLREYNDFSLGGNIDVLKLVEKYRQEVNPKINVFSVQVAGYNNSILPENLYRGALLTGWTGREPQYAKAIIDIWNEIEK